jgi:hypothetical protein
MAHLDGESQNCYPHNDHDSPPPQTCPTCGRPLTPPFDPAASGLLDWLLRIDEDLRHLKAEAEEAVLEQEVVS